MQPMSLFLVYFQMCTDMRSATIMVARSRGGILRNWYQELPPSPPHFSKGSLGGFNCASCLFFVCWI